MKIMLRELLKCCLYSEEKRKRKKEIKFAEAKEVSGLCTGLTLFVGVVCYLACSLMLARQYSCALVSPF